MSIRFLRGCQCIFSMWPLEKCMALDLNKFEFRLPKNTLNYVWMNLTQRFWRRFSKIVHRKRARFFIWKKKPETKGCSVPSLVEIDQVVLEKKSSMYFHYVLAIISLWQRAWPFIWTNLNHLHLRMLYVKDGGAWLRNCFQHKTPSSPTMACRTLLHSKILWCIVYNLVMYILQSCDVYSKYLIYIRKILMYIQNMHLGVHSIILWCIF